LSDVDGVIVNFQNRFVQLASELLGREFDPMAAMSSFSVEDALGLTREESDAVYEVVNSPGFAMGLPEMPGAVAGIKELMQYADVYFVTSHNVRSPTWVFEREAWLVERFGEQGRRTFHTKHKYGVVGDVFIDDKKENAEKWQKAHPDGKALLWAWPYNEGSVIPRIDKWQDVLDLIGFTA
jgi:5'(3')-deoxyribonucleotidase